MRLLTTRFHIAYQAGRPALHAGSANADAPPARAAGGRPRTPLAHHLHQPPAKETRVNLTGSHTAPEPALPGGEHRRLLLTLSVAILLAGGGGIALMGAVGTGGHAPAWRMEASTPLPTAPLPVATPATATETVTTTPEPVAPPAPPPPPPPPLAQAAPPPPPAPTAVVAPPPATAPPVKVAKPAPAEPKPAVTRKAPATRAKASKGHKFDL